MQKWKEANERLFQAIGDVGEDLVANAEVRRFSNHWRQWLSTAAALVLVAGLSLAALTYFPQGCASLPPENAEAPAEAAPEEAAPEIAEEETITDPAKARNRLVFNDTYYYSSGQEPIPLDTPPEDLGEALGTVTASEDKSLTGCKVYGRKWMDGYDDPSWEHKMTEEFLVYWEIYVETPEGYLWYWTYSEKTAARYSYEDAADLAGQDGGVNTYDLQAIFINRIENLGELEFETTSQLSTDELTILFLGTTNAGCAEGDDTWFSWAEKERNSEEYEDQVVIPVSDIRWRLDRFLDQGYVYDPAQLGTDENLKHEEIFNHLTYDAGLDALIYDISTYDEGWFWPDVWVNWSLTDAAYDPEAQTCTFVIQNTTTKNYREYVLRFDVDSWRYICIRTLEEYVDPDLLLQEPAAARSEPVRRFYELFDEVDRASMEAYLAEHPEALERGWEELVINEAGLDDGGTSITTKEGDTVVAVDVPNQILLVRIEREIAGHDQETKKCKAILAIAKDPGRLFIAPTNQPGEKGQKIGGIAENHNGVLAITGSQFSDPYGGVPMGFAMYSGKEAEYGPETLTGGNSRLEIHEDNTMEILDSEKPVTPGTRDALEYTAGMLIFDGKIRDNMWGFVSDFGPKECIGQGENGEILMLVVEGWLEGYSDGADGQTCADILLRYGVREAMSLDGGSTAVIWYDGEYINRNCDPDYPGGGPRPNAIVYGRGPVE